MSDEEVGVVVLIATGVLMVVILLLEAEATSGGAARNRLRNCAVMWSISELLSAGAKKIFSRPGSAPVLGDDGELQLVDCNLSSLIESGCARACQPRVVSRRVVVVKDNEDALLIIE